MTLTKRAIRGVSAGSVLAVGMLLSFSHIRINTTHSAPRGVYLTSSEVSDLVRGQYVLACLPAQWAPWAAERGYVGAGECAGVEPLLKRVAAVSGDVVTVVGDAVLVNGSVVVGSAPLRVDSAGRELPAFPPGEYRVQPGTTWLLSGYDPRSFDSRYFGPIALNQLLSVATPIIIE